MIIRQLSVFLANETGRMRELVKILGDAKVNITALSIAETADYGIVRMIADDTEKGLKVLRDAGFSAKTTEVLQVETKDEPGALSGVLGKLADEGINVEYIYGHSGHGLSHVIMRVSDPERASGLLRDYLSGG
ncbi:MAG: ACT domain-containing protein [Clostridiales Family XIII bacterium]|jgi:hypothetical protein|nr:ACT domain-containing protein [Clostridiales Family XIII bacterium]